MTKTYTFDVSTPAGSDNPTQGDDRIRELKDAIHERQDLDHYWEKSGDTADADDVGFHRKCTLLVQTSVTQKADAGIIYTKDVNSKAELHYKDEDGNEVQLSDAGNVVSVFASGDFLFTTRSGAITGYTDVTATYASKYLRIGNTGLSTGGNATHDHGGSTASHTLTVSEIPAHTHTVPLTNTGNIGNESIILGSNQTATVSTRTSSSTGGGGGHSHTISSANNDPLYVDVRMYQKD